MSADVRDTILSNAVWLLASLAVAIVVWFVAKIEADPVDQRQFFGVQVNLQYNRDSMIVTNDPRQGVRVIVRGQQSVLDLLTEEDITVTADLTGREPGATYTVPLQVQTSRPASADTQPAQISVTLAQRIAQQKPVRVDILPPPTNFEYDNLTQDVQQAEVQGAADDVASVVAVEATLDLSDVRNSVERNLSLEAIDEDGNVVDSVTITPRSVNVDVQVLQRDDVLRASVRPIIQLETLPDNYELQGFEFDPREVFLAGEPEVLAELGGNIPTEPISLEGRTTDFDVTVSLDLPSDNLRVLGTDANAGNSITVNISLAAQTTSKQVDDIPVDMIGLPDNYTATVNPQVISVLINGPVDEVERVTADDISSIIDLNNLEPGTYELAPRIDFGEFSFSDQNITRIPQVVNVTINAPTPEATAEATQTPPPEATAEATSESRADSD